MSIFSFIKKNIKQLNNYKTSRRKLTKMISGIILYKLKASIICKLISYLHTIKRLSFIYKWQKFFSTVSEKEVMRNNIYSGYVLIVVTCFIPIVLLGIRYAEKLFVLKDTQIKRASSEKLVKQCAREAALAVARNWNPGLTLGQQHDGIYKVADAIYNAHPCYHDSPLGHALPGMVAKDENGNVINLSANQKTVSYKTDNTMYKGLWNGEFYNGGSLWNVYFGNWRESDLASESERRVSVFDELDITKLAESNFVLLHHDIREDPHPHYNFVPETYPTDKYQTGGAQVYSYIPSKTTNYTNESYLPGSVISGLTGSNGQSSNGKYAGQSFTYSSRLAPSGTDYVEVSVENDKLKVRTDTQEDYAIPARCDVDIVLAVPVNGAASNIDGLDYASDTDSLAAATDTTGDPYKHFGTVTLPEEAKKTPIYQMGQALKNFVKEHFYHTRGVNMSLIPYSGKLSISPDRATSWTVAFPQFVDTSLNTQLMIGACLYGTSGEKDATLKQSYKTKALVSGATLPTTDTPYYWGGVLTGCPIMFRAGTQNISTTYGGNSYFSGFMLYTDDPSKGDSYKYLRMNLNPCYMGYANMLSMRCEKQCTHFLPNPYYMIEPTSDLVKIYEMCNALYPIYDTHNVSNFVFAALEWANNMFQSWTNDPSIAAKDGSGAGNAGATSDATLSRPSKTTSGRKKAVILLVNKPDWFEPAEMTYLGFNNDFSEVPTLLSDKIDFSINYGDTTKTFLDGSSYNTNHTNGEFSGINNSGLIAGANKILKIEKFSGTNIERQGNYYEVSNGVYRLKFPHKGHIKLVVAPAEVVTGSSSGSITFYKDNIGDTYDVHKDNIQGESITLGSPQTVAGVQTFVFSGGSVPTAGSSGMYSCSYGKNFRANLSVKKVKYSLSNDATITNCILKNQIIRFYGGVYYMRYYSNPGNYNGVTTTSPLILNDGTPDPESNYTSAQKDNNAGGTGDYDKCGWYTPKAYGTSGYVTDPYPLHRDSCFQFTSSTVGYYTNSWPWISNFSVKIDGVKNAYLIPNGNSGFANLAYVNSNGSQTKLGISSNWQRCDISSYNTTDTNYVEYIDTTSGYSTNFRQLYLQNKDDKILQGKITSDPINYDKLAHNEGVYLSDYNGEKWICFQGDGELHVTAVAGCILQFNNVADDSNAYKIEKEEKFWIEPSQISDNTDSDGNYYVEFKASSLKLISAEISNTKYWSKITPITAYYKDFEEVSYGLSGDYLQWGGGSDNLVEMPAETIDFTTESGSGNLYGNTIACPTNLTFTSGEGVKTSIVPPHTISLKLLVTHKADIILNLAKMPLPHGSITFYNDNGVASNVGTHEFDGQKSFSFYDNSSFSTSGYVGKADFGTNFGINKIKYSTSNAKVISVSGCGGKFRYTPIGVDRGFCMYKGSTRLTAYDSGTSNYWTFVMSCALHTYAYANFTSNGGTTYWYGDKCNASGVVDPYTITTSYVGNPVPSTTAVTQGNQYSNSPKTSTSTSATLSGFITNQTYTHVAWIYNTTNPITINWAYMSGISNAQFTTNSATDTEIAIGKYVIADGTWIKFGGTPQYGSVSVTAEATGPSVNTGYVTVNGVTSTKTEITNSSSQNVTIPAENLLEGNSCYYVNITLDRVILKKATRKACTVPKASSTRLKCSQQVPISLKVKGKTSNDSMSINDMWELTQKLNSSIIEICVYNNRIYVLCEDRKLYYLPIENTTGTWTQVGNTAPRSFYRADGNQICVSNNRIYVAYYYSSSSPYECVYSIPYDANTSTAWSTHGKGPDSNYSYNYAGICSLGNRIYKVRGVYNTNEIFINSIAYNADNSTLWTTLGSPTSGSYSKLRALCGADNNIYVMNAIDNYYMYSLNVNNPSAGFQQIGAKANFSSGYAITDDQYIYVHYSNYVYRLPLNANTNTSWEQIGYLDGSGLAMYKNVFYSASGTEVHKLDLNSQGSNLIINSGSQRKITGEQIIEIPASSLKRDSSDGKYYVDIEAANVNIISACATVNTSEQNVDDMIDFCGAKTSQNGVLRQATSGGISNGLYICTSGSIISGLRGEIELTVVPKFGFNITSKFRFTSGSNTTEKTISSKYKITIPETDLSPIRYTYNPDGSVASTIYSTPGFVASNLALIKAKIKVSAYDFVKSATPSRSSVVDFSQNVNGKPVHAAASLAVFGKNHNGDLPEVTFDSTIGYWCANNTGYLHFYDWQPYSKNDHYCFVEDLNEPAAMFGEWFANSTHTGHERKYYWYRSGITKVWSDYLQNWPVPGYHVYGKYKLIYGGYTQPINAVLYNYGVNTAKNVTSITANYVSPNNDFNRTVMKRLTTDACTKLKNANARVYVVKYRKQANWNCLTRAAQLKYNQITTAHSYSEIDACATSTGGKVYDIGTAADDTASNGTSANATALKETLDAIAADIKSWAGYEAAKLVEQK